MYCTATGQIDLSRPVQIVRDSLQMMVSYKTFLLFSHLDRPRRGFTGWHIHTM